MPNCECPRWRTAFPAGKTRDKSESAIVEAPLDEAPPVPGVCGRNRRRNDACDDHDRDLGRPPRIPGAPIVSQDGNGTSPFDFRNFASGSRSDSGSPTIGNTTGRPESPPEPTGWGASTEEPRTVAIAAARPPVAWLFGTLALAVIAGVVAVIFGTAPAVAITAWFLGGPISIALLAVYTFRDIAQRANVLYSVETWVPWLYRMILVLIFVAIIASALQIASWVGRL
jgi:hypothetical protein